jgi:UPF0271 protein
MGEGVGNEEALMPFINSANIACGYHAGDAATMLHVIGLCLKFNVHIGAHPSFPDRENFGRTEMTIDPAGVHKIVTEQLQIISMIAKKQGTKLHHVKPHGALYNMAAKDVALANAIAQAVKDADASLVYYGLSGSVMISEAEKFGLKTMNEVFADRTYQPDGNLTPRSRPDALINDPDEMITQVIKLAKENMVRTVNGEDIFIKADTICIHGDGTHAVEFAKAIQNKLREE